ncbi:hypothetical protein VNO78_06461 [Psophocarpus tetragonolobus]|uniref:Uncharacterized protein n=1 Tax=Psophocarpus tetragonolobus TaxID=3891 RepID=A0AAN9XS89_PSOTE
MKSVLLGAGANSSVITNVATDADILKFNITLKDRVIMYIDRLLNEITEEQHKNYLIVDATLVITATPQFELSPLVEFFRLTIGITMQMLLLSSILVRNGVRTSVMTELCFIVLLFVWLTKASMAVISPTLGAAGLGMRLL